MKKIKILFLFFCTVLTVNAQDIAWLNTIGAGGYDSASKIAVDNQDNLYILGNFSETVDFDPSDGESFLTSTELRASYVQKLDSDGNFIWAVSLGDQDSNENRDIAVNAIGQIAITGTFSDTFDLDPGAGEFMVSSLGESDIYYILLNADGTFNNGFTLGSSGTEYALTIEATTSGSFMIGGSFQNTIDFDPGAGVAAMTASASSLDAFVLEIASDGQYIQAFSFGEGGGIIVYDLKIDENQNILVSGTFSDTVDFDPSANTFEITGQGDRAIFAAKYNPMHELVWAKGFGNGDFNLRLRDLGLGKDNGILLTGAFGGTLDIDPGTGVFNITSNGDADVFILKLDEAGNFEWALGIGGTSFAPDEAFSITSDNNNNVIVSGKFADTVDFNPGPETFTLTSNGYKDIFLLQLNSVGQFLSAYSMGGPDLDAGVAVAVDNNQAIILGGTFRETADMYPGPGVFNRTSNGNADAFVMKLNNLVLGTDDISRQVQNILAYPNPTSGDFSIVFPETLDTVVVTLTNMLGQVVASSIVQQQKTIQLTLPAASGVYFCTVTSAGASHTIKLIKK